MLQPATWYSCHRVGGSVPRAFGKGYRRVMGIDLGQCRWVFGIVDRGLRLSSKSRENNIFKITGQWLSLLLVISGAHHGVCMIWLQKRMILDQMNKFAGDHTRDLPSPSWEKSLLFVVVITTSDSDYRWADTCTSMLPAARCRSSMFHGIG